MTETSKDAKLRKIAEKFRGDMERLGLGVSIQVGDGPMVEIVPPPECDGSSRCRAETHIEGCFRSSAASSARTKESGG